MVLAQVPRLLFLGVYEYVVTGTAGPTFSGKCTDDGLGMPDMSGQPLLPATGGGAAVWPAGTKMLVSFVNGDPTRPVLLNADPSATAITATLFASATLSLGDNTAAPVAHASWLTAVVTALGTFASALSSSVSLANVIASGTTLTTALAAVTPSPTTKVLAT